MNFNERTHFFIKIYLSHFILERVDVSVVCERWAERQGQTAILTQLLLLTIAHCVIFKNPFSTSSASWLGLLNRGSLRAVAPNRAFSVYKLVLTLASLSPTDSTTTVICLYSVITPTCFHFFFHLFTQVHLIDGSVKGQYTTSVSVLLSLVINNS